VVALLSAGAVMGLFSWAGRWERTRKYFISASANRNATDAKVLRAVTVNTLVSLVLVFGSVFGLRPFLFYQRPTPLRMMVLEGLMVIVTYDLGYYFMHRFLFHEWRVLRPVHAVHHAAHNPRAVDSFLLHPIENALGLLLLFSSIMLVGGIHLYTFAPIFTAYTTLNVLNHAGLNIPHFPFKTLGRIAVAHDKHHHSMSSGNYASITPLPDLIFGTLE
jgi:sterol desaturase/sphingolipid hydroxylase (fatty acid hydroxylase superfamily)